MNSRATSKRSSISSTAKGGGGGGGIGDAGGERANGVEFIVPLPAPADKSAQGALLVACSDGWIRTWDLGTGAARPELLSETYSDHIGLLFTAHAVSMDKTMYFTADVEGFIKVWDPNPNPNPNWMLKALLRFGI